ncbi:thymidylate synthase [uncultured phage cr128_1]|uniref:Flavin-dependent thymidylate synthase n=1 Tax=uncultured phage cr128_1 TaxID=2772076 RepID=A0A7M1RZY2_9CAUD|nr:thymidylate synthase [uncultured phage cr128_1]QOR59694.1 flavin-dependent thymidylate synthase [uncultured phage cr128_1]
MKLIKPSWEILEQEPGIDGIYKAIERAGRTCYKSEDKMTEDSAKGFVDRMIKSGHGAMLEHGTVYLKVVGDERMSEKYQNNPYSRVILRYPKGDIPNIHCIPTHYITTNFRVLIENGWLDDLQYICEPTEYHEKRITVHFICDRGVSHEFVRHRVFSFAQESTRYCNYSKDKFGNELTFIEPCWLEDYNYESNTYYNGFLVALRAAEANYLNLLKQWEDKIPDKRYKTGFRNNPWAPQQARAVLPNALKTELVMTGFINDWKHFFELRCAPNAHPSARELAIPLSEEFIKRGLV